MDAIDQAIYDTVHNSGFSVKELARRMGMGHQVLLNRANPNCDTHHFNAYHIVQLQDITGTRLINQAMVAVLGDVEPSEPKSLLAAVLEAEAEHGDIARTINDALADDHITDRERQKILREIAEAKEALNNLDRSVVAHNGNRFINRSA